MIQLSLFSFFALLEVIAALTLLLGVLYWRQRRLRSTNSIQYIDTSEDYPTPSLYLDSEAAKTKTFVEMLHDQPRAEPVDLVLRAALGLRAGLLRKESALAKTPISERDAALWTALAEQVAAVLRAEAFSHASAKLHAVHGEDTASTEVIAAQQARTIQHLREYIGQLLEKMGHQPSPDQNIIGRFDDMERANREMCQCIAVLEDENSFLRDQIAALLKTE